MYELLPVFAEKIKKNRRLQIQVQLLDCSTTQDGDTQALHKMDCSTTQDGLQHYTRWTAALHKMDCSTTQDGLHHHTRW